MKERSLSLSGQPDDLCVEAYTKEKLIEFTIERDSYPSVEIPRSGLVMLRNYINEFLLECEELENNLKENSRKLTLCHSNDNGS